MPPSTEGEDGQMPIQEERKQDMSEENKIAEKSKSINYDKMKANSSSFTLLHTTLYTLNFLWFFSGLVYFTFRTRRVFANGAKRFRKLHPELVATAAGDEWHMDLLKYLGSMGGSLSFTVLYQLLTATGESREVKSWLGAWGAAHASQALIGWSTIYGSGRWQWEGLLAMKTITYIDTLLWVLDWAAVVAL